MTTKKLNDLDVWIANLMEPCPAVMALKHIRETKDHLYNDAEQSSNDGWWICKTGTDAEGENSDSTYCVWRPAYAIASEPDCVSSRAAAMEVLKRCAEEIKTGNKRGIIGLAPPMSAENVASTLPRKASKQWIIGKIGYPQNFEVKAETLELAICLFAKKLFTK